MKKEWEKIELALKNKVANHDLYMEILTSLNPPATLEQIKLYENKLKVKLPSDFRDSLLIHNGVQEPNRNTQNFWLILDIVDGEPEGIYLNDIESNFYWWEENCYSYEGYEDQEYKEKGPFVENNSAIKDVVWNRKWIIISNAVGELHAIDLDPSSHGKHGQIIKIGSGKGDYHKVVGSSLKDIFERGSKKFLEVIKKNNKPLKEETS